MFTPCLRNSPDERAIHPDALKSERLVQAERVVVGLGGDYETLMQSIFNKLMILPDDVIVYSGHGPATTIGEEKANNPFILEYAAEMKR